MFFLLQNMLVIKSSGNIYTLFCQLEKYKSDMSIVWEITGISGVIVTFSDYLDQNVEM